MSRKTIALIIVLLAIAGGLLYFAAGPKIGNAPYAQPTAPPTKPSPTPVAQTTLNLSPNPLVIASRSANMNVEINTGENNVTAVQIELGFDPTAISKIDITAGTFFDNAIQLVKKVDLKTGRLTYILALPPEGTSKKGAGVVARISFTTILASGKQTQFTFLPNTIITAENVQVSVLKKADSATIFYVLSTQPTVIDDSMMGPVKPQ